MAQKKRHLKIVKSFASKSKPSLHLTGRWLEQAGFIIDMRVDVIVKDKCLVIVPSDTNENRQDTLA